MNYSVIVRNNETGKILPRYNRIVNPDETLLFSSGDIVDDEFVLAGLIDYLLHTCSIKSIASTLAQELFENFDIRMKDK